VCTDTRGPSRRSYPARVIYNDFPWWPLLFIGVSLVLFGIGLFFSWLDAQNMKRPKKRSKQK
jgi:hypothetical protein